MTKVEKAKKYRQMHDARLMLLFGDMLPDKENDKIKVRIDKWASKNGLQTFPERAISESLKTAKKRTE